MHLIMLLENKIQDRSESDRSVSFHTTQKQFAHVHISLSEQFTTLPSSKYKSMLTVPFCLADILSTACKIGWLEKGSIAHTSSWRYVIKVFHCTPNSNLGFLSLWGLRVDPRGVVKSKTYLQGLLYTRKLIHKVVRQKGCIYVYKSTLKHHTLLLDACNTYKHSITNYVARHATKNKERKIQAGNLITLQWHSSMCLSLLLCVSHHYETSLVMFP